MNRKQRRKYRKGPEQFAVYGITMDEMGTKGAEIMQKHPRAIVINISAQMRKLYAALDEVQKDNDK